MSSEYDHRKSERKPVSMSARCRTMSGMRDEGTLSDISVTGCCVATRSLYLTVGMRIIIKPEGMEAITGVVRWLQGNRAGVEFDSPLYLPMVEHLVQRFPSDRQVFIQASAR